MLGWKEENQNLFDNILWSDESIFPFEPFAPFTRTNFAAPLEAVSNDFFSPLRYRNGKKFYGLLVTCLVSRMIKIEVVNSLNANAALVALNNVFFQSVGKRNAGTKEGKSFCIF